MRNQQVQYLRSLLIRTSAPQSSYSQNSLSERNYRQGNAQCNLHGNTKEADVQGNAKEDDAQVINDKNNSPTSLNAILPHMTHSTTRAAAAASGLGIVHHVFAAKTAKPNDAMDSEVSISAINISAINKEVRGLFNRGAFSLVLVEAIPSHAYIIGTRIIIRLKVFEA
jgi:hypothetical protein